MGSELGRMKPGLEPADSPTNMDIAWAAGIYEGEGGSRFHARSTSVIIVQKDKWILYKLKRFFGGDIYKHGSFSSWRTSGTRARGFLMTIYSFLSPWRQEQARKALKLNYNRKQSS